MSSLDDGNTGLVYYAQPQRDPEAELLVWVSTVVQHIANLGDERHVLKPSLAALAAVRDADTWTALHATVAPTVRMGEVGPMHFEVNLLDQGFRQHSRGFGLRGAKSKLMEASPKAVTVLGWYVSSLSREEPADLQRFGLAAVLLAQRPLMQGVGLTQMNQTVASVCMTASAG